MQESLVGFGLTIAFGFVWGVTVTMALSMWRRSYRLHPTQHRHNRRHIQDRRSAHSTPRPL